MANCLATPATSINTPIGVSLLVTPTRFPSPPLVTKPKAKGVPAVGRTRMSWTVIEQVTPLVVVSVTVKVIWVDDTEVKGRTAPSAAPLIFHASGPDPVTLLIITVGGIPLVSNSNPSGIIRLRTPVLTSPLPPSV